ncbi:MAG: hypothetical protein RBT76_11525 [candidate division Zixibacteria bacterium]|jgi:hypothetical protein|nr:hypothetical protein [candidate division Zixibacteria bacterium]
MRTVLAVVLAGLSLCVGALAAEKAMLRPHVWFGTTVTSPSADDLGYVSADGDNLDSYLDHSKMNYGAGLQWFLPSTTNIRFGGDIGMRKLFSAEFNTGSEDISFVDEDNDTEDEYDIVVPEVAEYALPTPTFSCREAHVYLSYYVGAHNRVGPIGSTQTSTDRCDSADWSAGRIFCLAG